MTYVGKLLFSIAAIATSVYSMSAFGPGPRPGAAAATVGGSFRMSESNVGFSFLLAGLTVLGLSAFLWKSRVDRNSTDASLRGG
ncbi:MAG: hypothetical protein R3284_04955 [Rubricoccaceae bacterium]|nr:hypothetical protein [Rubricoccaceae bacterium]